MISRTTRLAHYYHSVRRWRSELAADARHVDTLFMRFVANHDSSDELPIGAQYCR